MSRSQLGTWLDIEDPSAPRTGLVVVTLVPFYESSCAAPAVGRTQEPLARSL